MLACLSEWCPRKSAHHRVSPRPTSPGQHPLGDGSRVTLVFNHDPLPSICKSSIQTTIHTLLRVHSLTLPRIDVPRRLRRAILLNDLPLVQRILRNNPNYLRNPDYEEKSNTNLHLAVKHGFTQIAVCCAYTSYVIASPCGQSSNNDTWAHADGRLTGVPR